MNVYIFCGISFRSVPKVLKTLSALASSSVPHFTSIINWILRLGLFMLQAVTQVPYETAWIIDQTIQVGRNKALVILRIPLDIMRNKKTIKIADTEVIYVGLQSKWLGSEIKAQFDELSARVGKPAQIILDGGADLNSASKAFVKESPEVHLTADITHLVGNLLKRKYQRLPVFSELPKQLQVIRSKLQQTSMAHLIPPTIRSKGRFFNLALVTNWVSKIWSSWDKLKQTDEKLWEEILGPIKENLHFLRHFGYQVATLNKIQEVLKTEGLNKDSYNCCKDLAQNLSSDLAMPVLVYLQKELEFAIARGVPISVTTDIIESLFGSFKNRIKTHSLAELNRLVLMMPCLGRQPSVELIKQAFEQIKMKDLSKWTAKYSSDTLLSKRRKILKSNSHEPLGTGEFMRENTG